MKVSLGRNFDIHDALEVRRHHLLMGWFPSFTIFLSKGLLGGGWTNPSEKYATVKLDHFPNFRGEKKIFETTT